MRNRRLTKIKGLQMIENDKNEDGLAAGCFGVIMAGMFIIGILMFMGTGA